MMHQETADIMRADTHDLHVGSIPKEALWWIMLFLNSPGVKEQLEDEVEKLTHQKPAEEVSGEPSFDDPSFASLAAQLATTFFAMRFPITSDQGISVFYYERPDIRSELRLVDKYCSEIVPVRQEARDIIRDRYSFAGFLQVTLDLLKSEHYRAEPEVLRPVMSDRRKPRTTAEKLARNYFAIIGEPDRFLTCDWDLAFFKRIWDCLVDGTIFADKDWLSQTHGQEVLRSLCRHCNLAKSLQRQHPVIACFFLIHLVERLEPFARLNAFMGRILYQLYAIEAGYSAIALLTFWDKEDDWFESIGERMRELETRKSEDVFGEPTRLNVDVTRPLQAWLSALVSKLEAMYVRARRLEDFTEELVFFLAAQKDFNSRQLAMISRALRSPDATFMISYHQKRHDLGYATAYRDFQELVDEGIFCFEKRSNPTVYRGVPHLEKHIAMMRLILEGNA